MRSDRDKPWHKNASNLLVVNSILAAISAVVIQAIMTETSRHQTLELGLSVSALFLFIFSAEKTAESFTDDDVNKYIRYCVPYNLGVLLLLLGVVGLFRHYAGLSYWWRVAAMVTTLTGWFCGWGCDTMFLIWRDRTEFQAWKDRLEGREGEAAIDYCDKLWLLMRKFTYKFCLWLRSWIQ